MAEETNDVAATATVTKASRRKALVSSLLDATNPVKVIEVLEKEDLDLALRGLHTELSNASVDLSPAKRLEDVGIQTRQLSKRDQIQSIIGLVEAESKKQ